MNEIIFETSWGEKLCFSPLISKAVADKFDIESEECQGFADMKFHNAASLVSRLGKRLPTSTELHELHLWLTKTSDRSWPIGVNAIWSSTKSKNGCHCSVLLFNANCDADNDSRHCFVSCVSTINY
ncbi:hypothetical protein MSG37_08440 [Shewanella sp. 1CM18E]|uniref:hypothetical protein n=1 Tax=Shewanella sp. 1CM18E TaxID=2929169 RepID=UPI0020C0D2CA|nr:hypothetical protein [Shewanella sp. 1CM18E]MCK8044912.1 hypothetical protein [Shewanella sp. 1CM18E]